MQNKKERMNLHLNAKTVVPSVNIVFTLTFAFYVLFPYMKIVFNTNTIFCYLVVNTIFLIMIYFFIKNFIYNYFLSIAKNLCELNKKYMFPSKIKSAKTLI